MKVLILKFQGFQLDVVVAERCCLSLEQLHDQVKLPE